MSNLQTNYHYKLDFQKVDQYTGGKWFMHGNILLVCRETGWSHYDVVWYFSKKDMRTKTIVPINQK